MAQQEGTNILIQGRVVWGSMKPQNKKIYGTQQPALDPKTGKQIVEYVFGLAIPKPSPQSQPHETQNVSTFWNTLQSEAAKIFPNGIPGDFKWKFVDGDGQKRDGTSYPEHSKGCLIVTCSTRLPLKLFAWEQGTLVQVLEDQIKCGDYVQVQVNLVGHGGTNAGMYINPSYVARVAHGQEIVNTPDPTTVFGTQAPAMPQGGTMQPQAPQGLPMGGMTQQMQPQGQPAGMPQMQQQTVQPNYGVLPPQMQPQAQATYPTNGGTHQGQAPSGMPQMPGMPGYPQR